VQVREVRAHGARRSEEMEAADYGSGEPGQEPTP
jgi:hypothetical protein